MSKDNKRPLTQIDGYIITRSWNKSGHVVQVAIETDEFERFIIAENETGMDLLNLLNKRVKIKGHLGGEYFDGNEIIFVPNFQMEN